MSPGDDPSGTAQVQAKSTRCHCAVLVAVVVMEVMAHQRLSPQDPNVARGTPRYVLRVRNPRVVGDSVGLSATVRSERRVPVTMMSCGVSLGAWASGV